jgi:hypothetical protein
MRRPLNMFKKLPVWILILIELLLVAAIGYVDYLTGDYSILIFYVIPIGIAAWCQEDWGAVFISIASGSARYLSDYLAYSSSKIRYWNSIEDMLFLLIVGLLISAVKRLIDDENRANRPKKDV